MSGFVLSPIKQIEIAAARIPGAISLAQGIPSFHTPAVIRDYVTQKVNEGLCDKYSLTIGLSELREEIALTLSKEGVRYEPDTEIIVTAGSIEGISASLLSLTTTGDEVIIPTPSYASYTAAVQLARCTPIFAELDEDNNFDFHIQKLKEKITRRTKVILYCSPNNPTGTLFSPEKTRAIVKLAAENNITILVDEVYKDFYYVDTPHFSPAHIPEARQHVLRVCSFSKTYAMTGWRVGFVHGDRSRIESIVKFHDAMVTCAPVVSQYAAIAALRFGDQFRNEFRDEFRKRRDFAIARLDELSLYLDYQLPKATYFLFPRIKDSVPLAKDSTRLAYDLLEKGQVAMVPGLAFGPSGESHLRINFGRDPESLAEGLSRFAEYLTATRRTSSPLPKQAAPTSKQTSILREIGVDVLGAFAKLYLARTKPLIIGIAGTRGKTVFKREILTLFKNHKKTRASILSYNTEVGLPLSIFNEKSPRTPEQKILAAFRIPFKAVAGIDSAEVLILEYGIRSAADAKQLLAIAQPDWLVISDVMSGDPNINDQEVIQGMEVLLTRIPKDRLLWAGTDPWLASKSDHLSAELRLVGTSSERDLVSQSQRLAVHAAVLLAQKIGLNSASISTYFQAA